MTRIRRHGSRQAARARPGAVIRPGCAGCIWSSGQFVHASERSFNACRHAGESASRLRDRVRFGTGGPARCLPHQVIVIAIDPADDRTEQTVVATSRRRSLMFDPRDPGNTDPTELEEGDPNPIGSPAAQHAPRRAVIRHICARGRQPDNFGCMIPASRQLTPRATFTASPRSDPCTSPFPGSHRPAAIVGAFSARSAHMCRSVARQPTGRRHPQPATSRDSHRAPVGRYNVVGSPHPPRGQESGRCPRLDAALFPAPPSSASPPTGRVSCMAGQPGFLSLPYLQ